jgi:hypothetical protein
MLYSPTELKQMYYQLGAQNKCPIKEANRIGDDLSGGEPPLKPSSKRISTYILKSTHIS